MSGTGQVAYSGPVELWLGRAARHLGDLDVAVDELDAARVICQQRGASGFEVESTVELAAALIDRGAVGDAKRAQAFIVAARAGANALGMPPFSASIDGLAARLAASRSDPLSRREREVAVLVADGLTNKQIAARLFLSERTAENHVQHILTKLGLANRAQIAVWSATNEGGF